eukprot:1031718-Alexandrium_andersonii.AAC.1
MPASVPAGRTSGGEGGSLKVPSSLDATAESRCALGVPATTSCTTSLYLPGEAEGEGAPPAPPAPLGRIRPSSPPPRECSSASRRVQSTPTSNGQ